MANTIDLSFVKQFESDVHLAYQRFGAKLTSTVRRKNVRGESTTFQTIGKAAAGQKARNGQVPLAQLAHAPVEVILADYYIGELIDKLDELKINHDERMVAARSLAAALGRQSDQIIINAMQTSTTASAQQTTPTGGLTVAKMEEVFQFFGDNDVPDDGQRFLAVSPAGWNDLMALPEFASADYVGSDLPYPMIGYSAKRWWSFIVFQHSGLTVDGTPTRRCFAYHTSAVGLGVGQDVYLDVTWQGKEQSWLTVAGMSMGSKVIDDLGVYEVQIAE